jgi:hypothetical protein
MSRCSFSRGSVTHRREIIMRARRGVTCRYFDSPHRGSVRRRAASATERRMRFTLKIPDWAYERGDRRPAHLTRQPFPPASQWKFDQLFGGKGVCPPFFRFGALSKYFTRYAVTVRIWSGVPAAPFSTSATSSSHALRPIRFVNTAVPRRAVHIRATIYLPSPSGSGGRLLSVPPVI